MATETTNFKLIKDAQTDYYNIDTVNANLDKIDKALGNTALFEKAGGTAAVITLTGIEFVDGRSKTFIVSASNNGADTKINGKPLYKPGTTQAPNLVAGKAVTVWYDAAGDCFFIKASASGTASPSDVLAEVPFSNEDGEQIGTMPNNGAVVITPGTNNIPISLGFHDGAGYVKGDPYLISKNIKKGITIFNIQGDSNVVDTEDANANASEILTNKTAYVKGQKITGSMPDRRGNNQTAEDRYATEQNLYLKPPKGYYDPNGDSSIPGNIGGWLKVTDSNYIAANIAKGKTVLGLNGTYTSDANATASDIKSGKTAYVNGVKITGTYNGVEAIFNFPITFSTTQPSPQKNGHIWIARDIGGSITNIQILEALNAGAANGTLMFVIGDFVYHNYSMSHTLTTSAGNKNFSITDNKGVTEWLVSLLSGAITHSLYYRKPLVYSKINNVLEIETAYMWNGSSWVMLCQRGSYLAVTTGSSSAPSYATVYNRTGYSSILPNLADITAENINRIQASADGTYIAAGNKLYKRTGDVFTEYYSIPTSNGVFSRQNYYLAPNGNLLISFYSSPSGYVWVMKDNGTTFTQIFTTGVISMENAPFARMSRDGNIFCMCWSDSSASTNERSRISFYFKDGDTYVQSSYMYKASEINIPHFSYDGKYLCVAARPYYNSSGTNYYYIVKFALDYNNKTATNSYLGTSHTSAMSIYTVHPSGYLLANYKGEIKFLRISDNAIININSIPDNFSSGAYHYSIDINGYIAVTVSSGTTSRVYIFYPEISGTNATITPITSLNISGSGGSYARYPVLIPY